MGLATLRQAGGLSHRPGDIEYTQRVSDGDTDVCVCSYDGLTCQTCLTGQAVAGKVSCLLPQEQVHQMMLPEPMEEEDGMEGEREREDSQSTILRSINIIETTLEY